MCECHSVHRPCCEPHFNPPEMTESFQPSKSVGRPEVLEKHWSSRTFSLFSSASFLGQSEPPPPTQPPPNDDVCWFSELQERESRPSEHQSLGGEPCSHPSWTLRRQIKVCSSNIWNLNRDFQHIYHKHILLKGLIHPLKPALALRSTWGLTSPVCSWKRRLSAVPPWCS